MKRSLLLLGGLFACSLMCVCCSGDRSLEAPRPEPSSTSVSEGDSMTIEGRIVTVMESWPLQLSVETDAGRYHVGLLQETDITRQGNKVEPGALRVDQRIRVTGNVSGDLAMTASAIEILP